MKILLGVTADLSLNFLLPSAEVLSHSNEVGVVSSPGKVMDRMSKSHPQIRWLRVSISRNIDPWRDLVALTQLISLFRSTRPHLIDFGTPKAGLLGMLGGTITGVPCRCYTLRGLRLETMRGWKRQILRLTEWLACKCADRVICVSPSLRTQAVQMGIVKAEKTVVLGSGSSRGVEMDRFAPTVRNLSLAAQLRTSLCLPGSAPIIGFVGRFTRDKGIVELLDSYDELRTKIVGLRLLMVGDFEDGDLPPADVRARIERDPSVVRTGFVTDTAPYYHLMDVLALPTYREGFPGVPLEAAAAGKPTVTTNATGAVDSVVDGVTGFVVPVGDASALAESIHLLLQDRDLRGRMGRAAQERVRRDFRQEVIREALLNLYRDLIRERGLHEEKDSPQFGWRLLIKRALDVSASALGLLLALPTMLIAALAIRVSMGGPVLFRQERPGLNGKPFTLFKFRTMSNARDEEENPLPDGVRLTRLGAALRSLSLDELPQLWNVLWGDLSLVGPRPLLMQYLDRYTPEQARRHDVLPGITGWTQINGRNALSWGEKFALDLWYVDNWSLALDFKILLKTLGAVVRRDGITNSLHPTMPEFLEHVPGDQRK
jgi:lipopolysaccharide/colanic/teichoic acid biosynthesis glycosyltransferase/glycosyltransferase involved in cell wall biosynthesis